MIVYDAQRRPIDLGKSIGHGGEAVVYRVVNQPGSLAKIYEPEPRANYAGKLAWMVEHPPENPTQRLDHASLAWPGGLLYDSRRRLKGYWMPYIQRTVPLLEVFNPRRRTEVLPEFDRRYLLRTARNLAAATSALHRSGYVAGDINESNVLVTPTALVTLIDTDSFQVREERGGNSIIHPCPVGKPEYTPPELQNHSLSEVIRQPDHDAFGLAVLIFQLLMEGSHPFRAQWLAAGDPPPLEARIANGAYPYVKTPAYPVLPPKNALGIDTLHPWLVELFHRCFVDGHRDPRWRPGPELWVRALEKAENSLICCSSGHYYSSHLLECPYCSLEQKRKAGKTAAPQKTTKWAGNRAGSPRPRAAWSSPASYQSRPAAASTPPAAAPAASAAAARPSGSAGASGSFFNRVGGWPGVTVSVSPSGGVSAAGPVSASGSPLGNLAANAAANVAANAASAIFGIPTNSTRGVLRSRPPMQPGAMKQWVRQRAYKSFAVGGLQGAVAGAVPGAVIGLVNWANGTALAWTLLFALGGAMGGLLRGWMPGHKVAALIDRYLGWKLFWQGLGLTTGLIAGGALGMIFIWAIFPVILGLFLGARGGLYLGEKIYQLGSNFGWERIWGALSGLGFGGLGYGIAQLVGLIGLNAFGANLAGGLFPFADNGSPMWAIIWMMAGGAGGAVAGALSGVLTDLFGRLSGLVD